MNTWFRLCSLQWDAVDARVACRQLGFGPTGKKLNSAQHSDFYGYQITILKYYNQLICISVFNES